MSSELSRYVTLNVCKVDSPEEYMLQDVPGMCPIRVCLASDVDAHLATLHAELEAFKERAATALASQARYAGEQSKQIATLTQQLAAREEHQQLHDRIFARQKFLLDEQCQTITRLEGVIREASARLEHSSHSKEQPEPYESRTPVIRAYLQAALTRGA